MFAREGEPFLSCKIKIILTQSLHGLTKGFCISSGIKRSEGRHGASRVLEEGKSHEIEYCIFHFSIQELRLHLNSQSKS